MAADDFIVKVESDDDISVKVEHADGHRRLPELEKSGDEALMEGLREPYTCSVCGYRTSLKKNLILHVKRHSRKKCVRSDYSDHLTRLIKIEAPQAGSGLRFHSCYFCGRVFPKPSLLKIHMMKHTGEKPYACGVCGHKTNHPTSLQMHMRTHTGEKPYVCSVCGYCCSQSGNLKLHMRKHTGERPYTCDVCGEKFSRPDHVARHKKRKHSGGKP